MDFSNSFDHYTNRRDLLRSFLDEYLLLAEEQPELVAQFTFNAFIHFSFAYYRQSRSAEQLGQLGTQFRQLRELLPAQPLANA